jgi:hypothetical protein
MRPAPDDGRSSEYEPPSPSLLASCLVVFVALALRPALNAHTTSWLGDNFSTWQYLAKSIQGMLQYQLFGIRASLLTLRLRTSKRLTNLSSPALALPTHA